MARLPARTPPPPPTPCTTVSAIKGRSCLGKRFGIRWVLRGVTFGIGHGEMAALLGPNGSGKSSILRILGTLLRPNAGTATVNGRDIVAETAIVRGQVGYLAHTPGLYDGLTARENLLSAADMLGLPHASVDGNLARVGLGDLAANRVRGFPPECSGASRLRVSSCEVRARFSSTSLTRTSTKTGLITDASPPTCL